jgi:hypothetical protein
MVIKHQPLVTLNLNTLSNTALEFHLEQLDGFHAKFQWQRLENILTKPMQQKADGSFFIKTPTLHVKNLVSRYLRCRCLVFYDRGTVFNVKVRMRISGTLIANQHAVTLAKISRIFCARKYFDLPTVRVARLVAAYPLADDPR